MSEGVVFAPVGDCALAVVFGAAISPAINKRIRRTVRLLAEETVPGIVETVPTYASLLVIYDPLVMTYDELCERLLCLTSSAEEDAGESEVRVVEIPTVYGGAFGMDMETVCRHTGLDEETVIAMHSGTDYLVYMLGFIPGFTYLGGMNSALATPRLATPRTLIPAGSVGIAGAQTGIYPSDSPGGWQIIGRTPLCLYDGTKATPTLLAAGDYVRYVPIDEGEYRRIAEAGDDYEVRSYRIKEGELNDGQ